MGTDLPVCFLCRPFLKRFSAELLFHFLESFAACMRHNGGYWRRPGRSLGRGLEARRELERPARQWAGEEK